MKLNVTVCSIICMIACLWICIKWRVIYDSNCFAQSTDYESVATASGFTQMAMLLWCTVWIVTSYCMLIKILKTDFPVMK